MAVWNVTEVTHVDAGDRFLECEVVLLTTNSFAEAFCKWMEMQTLSDFPDSAGYRIVKIDDSPIDINDEIRF